MKKSNILKLFLLCGSIAIFSVQGMNNRKRRASGIPIKPAKQRCIRTITNLFDAAKEGNFEQVKEFLNNGANPNQIVAQGINKGKTPLLIAVKMGHLAVVKELLNNGAQVDYVVQAGIDEGTTPLFWAVQNKNTAIVKVLRYAKKEQIIKKGIYKNLNVLSVAAQNGNVEGVYYLLKQNLPEQILCNALNATHNKHIREMIKCRELLQKRKNKDNLEKIFDEFVLVEAFENNWVRLLSESFIKEQFLNIITQEVVKNNIHVVQEFENGGVINGYICAHCSTEWLAQTDECPGCGKSTGLGDGFTVINHRFFLPRR